MSISDRFEWEAAKETTNWNQCDPWLQKSCAVFFRACTWNWRVLVVQLCQTFCKGLNKRNYFNMTVFFICLYYPYNTIYSHYSYTWTPLTNVSELCFSCTCENHWPTRRKYSFILLEILREPSCLYRRAYWFTGTRKMLSIIYTSFSCGYSHCFMEDPLTAESVSGVSSSKAMAS